MKFDLELFKALNEEYRDKPVAKPRIEPSLEGVQTKGHSRLKALAKLIPISGRKGLEIGCGHGETCRAMVTEYKCQAVGVDITRYPEWDEELDGLTLIKGDLSAPDGPSVGHFDFACSYSVFEHLRHPFSMLKAVHKALKPGGKFYLSANLYRSPTASHRYREVFFPWPHLLFTDEVFEEYYRSIGMPPMRPAWINQLSIADYMRYFEITGFKVERVKFRVTPIDEDFYRRFADVLERFPRYDLERRFINALLVKVKPPLPTVQPDHKTGRKERLKED